MNEQDPADPTSSVSLEAPRTTMTAAQRRAQVEAIHAAEGQIVLAVTGGGMQVVSDLMLVPGASRTVLEIVIPYASSALSELTGRSTAAVTPDTAQAMAQAAYQRALSLAPAPTTQPLAGVACTAALVTDRTRRGDDRACIAYTNAHHQATWTLPLEKATPDQTPNARATQDRTVADALLEAIARALDLGKNGRTDTHSRKNRHTQ